MRTSFKKYLPLLKALGVGVSVISYEEIHADAYKPTSVSLLTNFLPLALAALAGIVNYRFASPEEFSSDKRHSLNKLGPHVANVNTVLEEKSLHINDKEYILIHSQQNVVENPGDVVDSVLESMIAKEFYDSYQEDIKTGTILKPAASKEQLQAMRKWIKQLFFCKFVITL